jgi:3-oxoacyl-[acyl-carrier-protein] synthase-3
MSKNKLFEIKRRNAVIKGIGSYAPERILTNQYFNDLLGEDVDTWLRENLTIRERRWCNENQSTADLCVEAGLNALNDAKISPEDLDLIIVATDTPEYISPSTASVVQYRLGAKNAGTFDINTACAGFVTALNVGSKFIIADEKYNNVLVIGAYAMSKYLDLTDKKTVTLFADGAGAVILSAEEFTNRGFLFSELISKGEYHDWMGIYAGGTYKPISEDVIKQKDHLLKFVKKFPKEINPTTWTQMIKNICQKFEITPQDIDHYFFTQININSIRETLEGLNVPFERTHTIMDRFAYTGSACIPMALDDAYKNSKLKKNQLAVFVGSGGGLAFASALFRL